MRFEADGIATCVELASTVGEELGGGLRSAGTSGPANVSKTLYGSSSGIIGRRVTTDREYLGIDRGIWVLREKDNISVWLKRNRSKILIFPVT